MAAGKASGQSEEDFASLTAQEREALSGLDRSENEVTLIECSTGSSALELPDFKDSSAHIAMNSTLWGQNLKKSSVLWKLAFPAICPANFEEFLLAVVGTLVNSVNSEICDQIIECLEGEFIL
ncbi:hypothetical protein DUI87_15656 [Hirundo rustica rustica]|uniref:Uncharacterized protein n=1 Tax=Hirundo rustica rustica TaxID=333673 RepID=A0A3M0JZE6_HIRRU|nr:hypothetical protein DUI87_15656 [Hirundo rustica rustica]